jgi:V/A-type H+-transporting ATPase subunit C
MGRLKAMTGLFLPRDTFSALLAARDMGELAKILESTTYSADITHALETYEDSAALEVAINRHFVTLTRLAYEAAPFAGKPVIGAYLKWWDIENILAIIASKAYGRLLSESGVSLISDNRIPAAVAAGMMTIDDLRGLIAQPSVEAVVHQLSRFGYGITLMEHLDRFLKEKNLFPIAHVLERNYYAELCTQCRFFQGDEWVVREFIYDEIDVKNILTLLKGKDSGLALEVLTPLFLDNGRLTVKRLQDLAASKDVDTIVSELTPAYDLVSALPAYKDEGSLVAFDIALRRQHALRSLERMRIYPLSLAGLFHFLLLARTEREDLRKIIYGKVYQIPVEKISRDLVLSIGI